MIDNRTPKTSIVLLLRVIFAAIASRAQSAEKLTRITVGYSAISYEQLPAWLAKETGLFAKNGLGAQLVYFTGGTKAAVAKHFGKARDKESMEKAYDRYLRDNQLRRKQYPSLEGIKTVLDTVGEKDPKARTIKPEDLVDLTFIKELDQSGFIDSLYAR